MEPFFLNFVFPEGKDISISCMNNTLPGDLILETWFCDLLHLVRGCEPGNEGAGALEMVLCHLP